MARVKEALFASFVLIFLIHSTSAASKTLSEHEMKEFLDGDYEKKETEWCTKLNEANWAYETNIKDKTAEENLLKITLEAADFEKKTWREYFEGIRIESYKDEDLRRKLKFLRILGKAALHSDKLAILTNLTSKMTNIYSTAKICPYKKQECDLEKEGLSLTPGLEDVMAKSKDYEELLYTWIGWRRVSGAKMKKLYKNYVDLSNEASVANGFNNTGEEWRFSYESKHFISDIDRIWGQLEPLYSELHKYVAKKLKARYGNALDISDGLLPAHVLGNMWAQTWNNIDDLVKPFPSASKVDITDALVNQKYTVLKMFETANDFYKSMGLSDNQVCYGEKALIEKPKDGKEVVCHASAWDFCDGKDFRIKMCTNIDAQDFVVIHHEMGHIEYYQQYKKQPFVYRNGANPGFHEAIGDTIALSVETPKHLEKIGLLKNYVDTEESSINALMSQALQKIAFLPFGLLIDKWRWDVFSGSVPQEKWNSLWWEYRKRYQKIKAPISRSDEADFDPGAKFHVAADSQYIAYFVAHVAQFQFYKSLCIAAGEYDDSTKNPPLHKCDFYQSTAAGDLLKAGLSMGSSKHWSVAMKAITGQEQLDASALMEYFHPLYEFLKKENSR